MESTAHEQQEMNNELNSQNVAYTAARNQLDSEINLLRVSCLTLHIKNTLYLAIISVAVCCTIPSRLMVQTIAS